MTSDLLKRYALELAQLEDAPPSPIELPPLAAIAIVSLVQLASRHPSVGDNSLVKIAIDAAMQIQGLFNSESAAYQVLELGWNSDADIALSESDDINLSDLDDEPDDGGYDPIEDADCLWSSNHDGFFDNIYGKPATEVNDGDNF